MLHNLYDCGLGLIPKQSSVFNAVISQKYQRLVVERAKFFSFCYAGDADIAELRTFEAEVDSVNLWRNEPNSPRVDA